MKNVNHLILCCLVALFTSACNDSNKSQSTDIQTDNSLTLQQNTEKLLPPSSIIEAKKALGKGKPVLFEIGAESCLSCREMGKILFRMKQQHPEMQVFFIDVSRDWDSASELKVKMIPTQIFYAADGKEIDRHIGGIEQSDLTKKLTDLGYF